MVFIKPPLCKRWWQPQGWRKGCCVGSRYAPLWILTARVSVFYSCSLKQAVQWRWTRSLRIKKAHPRLRQARLEHALPDDGCFCNLSACRIWQASACLHPAALKSCEKHLSVRCEQFNIRDFCRYKENTAENTCRIFKVFDAITAKISMLNQYGFGSRLPGSIILYVLKN